MLESEALKIRKVPVSGVSVGECVCMTVRDSPAYRAYIPESTAFFKVVQRYLGKCEEKGAVIVLPT